ncbi:MAG: alpha/beta fold hydrolase [Myxococcota bacterium]
MTEPMRDPVFDAPWMKTLERKQVDSLDGTRISYEVLGQGDRVLLVANGLGARLYSWQPLVEALWKDFRIITWDYRGLFESDTPKVPRRLALQNHADDAVAILQAEGARRAVLIGWSMGVQVSLDVAACHPDLVAGLVLLNGTYGHVYGSGFQPWFAMPWLPKRLHTITEWLRKHPKTQSRLAAVTRATEWPTVALMTVTSGRRSLAMRPVLRRYLDDVLGPSFENFMRLFQELDAHSVYHLLPEIQAPSLIVSGMFDLLTPPRLSREMARRLPDAEHIALKRCSHFAMLERPDVVIPKIRDFVCSRAHW